MANLIKWFQDAANNVGQAIDNVVPGNQSALHRPQAPQQPVQRPQAIAPPPMLQRLPSAPQVSALKLNNLISSIAHTGVNAPTHIPSMPEVGGNALTQSTPWAVGEALPIPILSDALRANDPVVTKQNAKTFAKNAIQSGYKASELGAAAQVFSGLANETTKRLGLNDGTSTDLLNGDTRAYSNQVAEDGLGTTLFNNAMNIAGAVGAHGASKRLPQEPATYLRKEGVGLVNNEGGFIAGSGAKDFAKNQAKGKTFIDPADNLPKFEVSDHKASVRNGGLKELNAKGETTLGNLINHKELFKQYGKGNDTFDARTVRVTADSNLPPARHGQYDPATNTITLNPELLRTKDDILNSLVHENQHGVDVHEGVFGGTNPEQAGGFDNYLKNIGEQRATDQANRRTMTPQERAANPSIAQAGPDPAQALGYLQRDKVAQAIQDTGALTTNHPSVGVEKPSHIMANETAPTSPEQEISAIYRQANAARNGKLTMTEENRIAELRGHQKPIDIAPEANNVPKEQASMQDSSRRYTESDGTLHQVDIHTNRSGKKMVTDSFVNADGSLSLVSHVPLTDKNANGSFAAGMGDKWETPKATKPTLPEVPKKQEAKPPTPVKTKRAPQTLNTDRLNISEDAKPEINALSMPDEVTRMTDKEVQDLAQGAGMDLKSYSIEKTRQKVAEQLNLRKEITRLSNEADKLLKEGKIGERAAILGQIRELGTKSREQGTDIARQLSARRIVANELASPEQRIFTLLDKAGVDPEVYLEKAAKVDFNDGKAVISFYRDLVPAKAGDWVDLVRYNSMLSSPLTQIVNITSTAGNLLNGPIEKEITATLDSLRSFFTAGEKKYAHGEGVDMIAGALAPSNLRQAVANFRTTLKGLDDSIDYGSSAGESRIPVAPTGRNASMTVGIGKFKKTVNVGRTHDALDFPMRLLGAFDQFNQQLVRGGAMKGLTRRENKGIRFSGSKENIAKAEGEYRTFNQEVGDKSNGYVLSAIDEVTTLVSKARSSKNPVLRWSSKMSLPFVRIGGNLMKHGIEYSPTGVVTMLGATEKTPQLAKAIMGTAVMGSAGALLGADRLTWAAPTDKKKKEAWDAAGMQAYSVKVGNTWFELSKLPPVISFNFAFVAALDDAQKKSKIDDKGIDNLVTAAASYGKFIADGSYFKNMGDALTAVQGGEAGMEKLISNYPQQFIPGRALSGWLARMTDDTQRKVNTDASFAGKQLELLMQQIPVLREKTTAKKDLNGNDLAAQHPVLNSFSPVKISSENDPAAKDYLAMLNQKTLDNANSKITGKKTSKDVTNKTGVTDPQAVTRIKAAQKTFASGLSKQANTTLTDYAKLDTKGKSDYNNDPAKVYQLHLAQYENDKANGKFNQIEDYKKLQSLGKEAVTSKYSQEVQQFYGMSKAQQSAYFATDRAKATDLYNQAKQLDAELGAKKFATGTKYKYGLGTKGRTAKGKSTKFKLPKTNASLAIRSSSAMNKLMGNAHVKAVKVPHAPKLAKAKPPKIPVTRTITTA